MLLYLFPAAAAASFGVLNWADLKRYLPLWGPAVVIWALAIGREPSVVFLGIFLVPTIVMGVAVALRRLSPTPFVLLALSDILLGLALSIYQSKTALWTLPAVGEWGPAAGLAAAAAILRLGSASDVKDSKEGGLVSLGWWQGAMIAYWVGPEGVALLVAGGILLWGTAAYASHSNLAALSLSGGVLAVAAGLGADVAGVIVLGLAGTALVLGERVVATWLVAILPVSLLTLLALPSGELMVIPAVVFPGAWAAMTTRLAGIKPTEAGMSALQPAASMVGIAFAAALVSSFFTGGGETGELGLPVEALNGVWLVYGAGLAAMVAYSLVGSGLAPRWEPEPPGHYYKAQLLLPKLLPGVAWFILVVAVGIAVRLLLAGFRTAFL